MKRTAYLILYLLGATSPAMADDASDLSSLKSDASNLQRTFESLNRETTDFLNLSRELRSKDSAELASLIKAICGQDLEQSGDDADRIANDLVFDAVSEISQSFNVLEDNGERLDDQLENLLNSLKSTRDRYRSLASSAQVGSEAQGVLGQIESNINTTDRRYAELKQDYNTLLNVRDNVMKGSNNPKIRAALDYGKAKHIDLQRSLSCDATEVSVSGGRADCVKFDSSYGCLVIEIKPDTYSRSDAERQASGYVDGLKKLFKDNSKAMQYCKMDSSGDWIFTPRAEFYPACRP